MTDKDHIQLNPEELASIEARLKSRRLEEGDFDLLLRILKFLVTLQTLLATRRLGLMALLRKIFGLKTELKSGTARDKIGKNPKSGNTASPKAGRNGRDDYPGARKIACSHETLKVGDLCPSCQEGKLTEVEPSVAYEWHGQPPLSLSIYLLQRLLCAICKTSFTAKTPEGAASKTVDDAGDDCKVARCDANARANTMVASLRYEYGVPGYRLAKIQSRHGLALPEGTQWRMITQVKASAMVIYAEMIRAAAASDLVMNDDTKMKVLDVIKDLKQKFEAESQKPKVKRKKGGKKPRTSTRATTIVAKTDDKTIVLYFTGIGNAGENLKRILDERPEDMAPPMQMCDGLNSNKPGHHETLELNCLTHGRRGFFELYNAGQKSLEYVIDLFGKIYAVDAAAKERG